MGLYKDHTRANTSQNHSSESGSSHIKDVKMINIRGAANIVRWIYCNLAIANYTTQTHLLINSNNASVKNSTNM